MEQWLRVDISLASIEFILLRPTLAKPDMEGLSLDPC